MHSLDDTIGGCMEPTSGYVDLVGLGFDLALRFGSVSDSSLRIRSIGQLRQIVCAAPSYLTRHETPQTPGDLSGHRCLIMTKPLQIMFPPGRAQPRRIGAFADALKAGIGQPSSED